MQKTLIDPLTSARGFAAIFVVVYHIKDRLGAFEIKELVPALQYGWLGVDFFFILSGFILAYVYGPGFANGKYRFFDFILARIARIYPVHLVTLLFWVGLGAWSGFLWSHDRFGIPGFVSNLLMIHAWNVLPQNTWNFPAWSISAEWFAYLIFPITMMIVGFVKRNIVLNLAIAIMLILSLELWIEVLPGRRFNWTYEWSVVRILCEFTAGVFLYRVYEDSKDGPIWNILAAVSVIASLALLTFTPNIPLISVPTMVVILIAISILSFARMSGFMHALFSMAPLTYLGRISYSMYMWHAAPLFILTLWMRRNMEGELDLQGGIIVFVIYMVLVCIGAVVLYHFVEKPMQKRVRGWGRKFIDREVTLENERAAKHSR